MNYLGMNMQNSQKSDTALTFEQQYSSILNFKKYGIFVGMLVSVILLAIMFGILFQTKNLFNQHLLDQSKIIANELNVLRDWIIKHRGIYVKESLAKPNLDIKGVSKKISTQSIITNQNEAYIFKRFSHISKELSDISLNSDSDIFYHATSFNPINPGDAPDAFEKKGLSTLQKTKASEHYGVDSENGKFYFRYMEPKITTSDCMICHAHYGYEPGRVSSALSVKIDITKNLKQLRLTSIATIALLSAVIAMTVALLYFTFKSFTGDLIQAEKRLKQMALFDSLTGIYSRGTGFSLLEKEIEKSLRMEKPLFVLMIDIDKFKSINDTYGHDVGDIAIKELASTVTSALRNYDIIFRYGGEEFVVILPETDSDKALMIAERIRKNIENNHFLIREKPEQALSYTISIGCAMHASGISADMLIAKADKALYKAKSNGRNRVEV